MKRIRPDVRIVSQTVLMDDWARVTRYEADVAPEGGRRQRLVRQVYDAGNGAAVLPVDRARGTVILIRQFRMPVYVSPRAGDDGMLIEACAGRLEGGAPEAVIRKEAEEEIGYRLHRLTQIFDVFMSPGAVSEHLALFVAAYTPSDRIGGGGGAADEGEDIEVMELPLVEALAMVQRGEIADAKTVLLLQYLALNPQSP